MKLNYYARINEGNICIEIVSTPKNLKGVKGYVSIVDYNETLLYRKYDAVTGWSEERYEPEVDVVIQERISTLEGENTLLKQTVSDLEGTINEMMSIIGGK